MAACRSRCQRDPGRPGAADFAYPNGGSPTVREVFVCSGNGCACGPGSIDPHGVSKVSSGFFVRVVSAAGFPNDAPGLPPGVDGSTFAQILGFQPGLMSGTPPVGIPPYDTNGDLTSCNIRGVSSLGTYLLNELMDKGMMIDIDHMSIKSLDDTLDLAEQRSYPLVASHVLFFDLQEKLYEGVYAGRHERLRTRPQLERMKNLGSLIAVTLKDDVVEGDFFRKKFTLPYTSPNGLPIIRDDCRSSTKTWAQAYEYAINVFGTDAALAVGSDFNGVAGHVGPRFGNQGCGGEDPTIPVDGYGRANERSAQERHSRSAGLLLLATMAILAPTRAP